MTLTVTQNLKVLNLTVSTKETTIVINPVIIKEIANTINGSNNIIIDGFYCDTINKIGLSFEVGDTFYGWDNDRFVRGKILSLPVTLPADIDDKSKVGLIINNTY